MKSHLVFLNASRILIVSLFTATSFAVAADWPQYCGPQRNGVSLEKGLSATWPADGPRLVWRAMTSAGFSSLAVSNGRLYTMGNSGGQDIVYCLDATNGATLWKTSYRCPAKDYAGPRATPTVDGARVYTLSREGQLFCLNTANGKPIWSKHLKRELGVRPPTWGFAGSPLVEGRLLILNVGTAGVAVDKMTGKIIWKSGQSPAGYASPIPVTIGGQRSIVLFTASAVISVNPQNGQRLWQYAWRTQFDVNAADPVIAGNRVFISSNYGKGCALLQVGRGRAGVVWANRNMKNQFASSVLVNGFLFGNDEGTLRCLDFRTGAVRWNGPEIGKGGLMAVDGKLLIISERGELAVAKAVPTGYQESARAQVLGGTCWIAPIMAGGRIYCRNHEGQVVCLKA